MFERNSQIHDKVIAVGNYAPNQKNKVTKNSISSIDNDVNTFFDFTDLCLCVNGLNRTHATESVIEDVEDVESPVEDD